MQTYHGRSATQPTSGKVQLHTRPVKTVNVFIECNMSWVRVLDSKRMRLCNLLCMRINVWCYFVLMCEVWQEGCALYVCVHVCVYVCSCGEDECVGEGLR